MTSPSTPIPPPSPTSTSTPADPQPEQLPDRPGPVTAPRPAFSGSTPAPPRPPNPSSSPTTDPIPDLSSFSPASTERNAAADRAALAAAPDWEEGIAHAVHAAGDQLNEMLAPGSELFLTDVNDEAGIAKPLSRVVARRMPARMLAVGNPDLKDAGTAALILARYLLKQVNLFRAYKREGMTAPVVQATDA